MATLVRTVMSRNVPSQLRLLAKQSPMNTIICGFASAATLKVTNVKTDAEFDTHVLKNSKAVIVDFHAQWCGPCKTFGPLLEKACAKYSDSVEFVKIDVDDNPALAEKYNVMSIPAVYGFKNGKSFSNFVGSRSMGECEQFIERLIH